MMVQWTGDDVDSVAVNAYDTLVNISADGIDERLQEMLTLKCIDRVFETLGQSSKSAVQMQKVNSALMLLANLTTPKEGAGECMQSGSEDPTVVGLRMRVRLVEPFLANDATNTASSSGTGGSGVGVGGADDDASANAQPNDPWEHAASVLCNVSQLQDGRDLIRRRSTRILPRLLTQLEASSAVRRRGAAAAVRNCCYETQDHDWLLHEVGCQQGAALK